MLYPIELRVRENQLKNTDSIQESPAIAAHFDQDLSQIGKNYLPVSHGGTSECLKMVRKPGLSFNRGRSDRAEPRQDLLIRLSAYRTQETCSILPIVSFHNIID